MSLLREIIAPDYYYGHGDKLMGDAVKLEQSLYQLVKT